ncbi:hypothetical protein RvY_08733 [Ramazzottius varieornatus]|uniref:BHLH domain-containing protein n=1 Tax=Ramazzottius varieornatus TaxID=947166 RepID=A0A1D1VBJ7_RAMVA|nr:hypothetical protein RvY_08733 [Ramazzottius varieornatus]
MEEQPSAGDLAQPWNRRIALDTATTRTEPLGHLNEEVSSPINGSTATLRERSRMHALNTAFDQLRAVVPRSNLADHQRLSKIATLRLAIHYINALFDILKASGGLSRPLLDQTPRPVRKGRKPTKTTSQRPTARKKPSRPSPRVSETGYT